MIKDEAKFHSQLMRWLQHNKQLFPPSYLIETKVVRRDSNRFPLRELSAKERRLLWRAKHSQVLQTHSDYGGMGTNCDVSAISGGGYIFLKWTRRGNRTFYVMDIDDLETYEKSNKIKSLTEDDARNVSFITGELCS